eukprot:CAMPEP_0117492038 /NCGR_PEP_ID=MMETSP0784-20121206/18377_1 /TAXON_ID=39447 /ORGANISM="" /LENGTH=82 /DNA_ID=CAMNT_0005286849 /DNA_START=202 /DNA_END=450 /DNA_ORIENTATION=+
MKTSTLAAMMAYHAQLTLGQQQELEAVLQPVVGGSKRPMAKIWPTSIPWNGHLKAVTPPFFVSTRKYGRLRPDRFLQSATRL